MVQASLYVWLRNRPPFWIALIMVERCGNNWSSSAKCIVQVKIFLASSIKPFFRLLNVQTRNYWTSLFRGGFVRASPRTGNGCPPPSRHVRAFSRLRRLGRAIPRLTQSPRTSFTAGFIFSSPFGGSVSMSDKATQRSRPEKGLLQKSKKRNMITSAGNLNFTGDNPFPDKRKPDFPSVSSYTRIEHGVTIIDEMINTINSLHSRISFSTNIHYFNTHRLEDRAILFRCS